MLPDDLGHPEEGAHQVIDRVGFILEQIVAGPEIDALAPRKSRSHSSRKWWSKTKSFIPQRISMGIPASRPSRSSVQETSS